MGGHWSRSDGTIGPARSRVGVDAVHLWSGAASLSRVDGPLVSAPAAAVAPLGFSALPTSAGVWRWRNDGTQEMSMGRVVIPIPTSPLGHARSPAALHARNQGPSRVVLHQTDLRRAPSTSRVSQTNAASLGRAPGDEGIRDSAMGGGLRVGVGLCGCRSGPVSAGRETGASCGCHHLHGRWAN